MKLNLFTLLLCSSIATKLLADDIQVIGSFTHPLMHKSMKREALDVPTETQFLKIKLSEKAKKAFALQQREALIHKATLVKTMLPSKIELGMANVPVLNQGKYGSCVTFAVTAAVDAIINKGDYISQLCQLELGNYLAHLGYQSSGWNGTLGRYALAQMDLFGIVNKTNELEMGCGELHAYPMEGEIPQTMIHPEAFHQISESLKQNHVAWSPILDVIQAVDRMNTEKTLNEVKLSLNKGNRVAFAVLLPDLDLGFGGAVGTHNTMHDSWVLTPIIGRDLYMRDTLAGHEMVITGYDDDAVAQDDDGYQHKGLLTLRNSWGENRGDKGTFYMSYDYFKLLVIEAASIRKIDED